MKRDLAKYEPKDSAELYRFAEAMASTQIIPQAYQNKPNDIVAAVITGNEIGFSPLASLRYIAIINGRGAVYGDALLALVKQHPDHEWTTEEFSSEKMIAKCTIKRKGEPEYTYFYSLEEAKIAGLAGKDNWKKYPKRMLEMRARAFAIRGSFPDALAGLITTDEAADYPTDDNIIRDPIPTGTTDTTVEEEKPKTRTEQIKATVKKRTEKKKEIDPDISAVLRDLAARPALEEERDTLLAVADEGDTDAINAAIEAAENKLAEKIEEAELPIF